LFVIVPKLHFTHKLRAFPGACPVTFAKYLAVPKMFRKRVLERN